MQPLASPIDHESRYHSIHAEDDIPTIPTNSPNPQEYTPLLSRYPRTRTRAYAPFFITLMLMVLVLGVLIGTYLLIEQDKEWPVNVPFDMVSRKQWGAKPPKGSVTLLSLRPPSHVIITHTNTSNCDSLYTCKDILLGMQDEYQTKPYNFSDLPFNYLIGNDGETYEGRGWDLTGDVDSTLNHKALSIGLIGNYAMSSPNKLQLNEVRAFLDESVRRRKLVNTYVIVGRPFNGVPKALFSAVKNWSHWSEN